MNNMKISIKPLHAVIGAAVILALGGFGGWTYYSVYVAESDDPAVLAVAGALQLPAARVGGTRVMYTDYQAHLEAQEVFLNGPTAQAQGLARELNTEDRVQAYERAIRIAAVNDMAVQAGIIVTELDVDRTYQDLIARAGTSTSEGEIERFLQDEFGWSKDEFKQFVVRPALIEDTLKQKRFQETEDALTFDRELAEKINGEETKRYLKF